MEANNNTNQTSLRNRRQKNAANSSGLEEALTLRDILDTFVGNWVWFFLSVVICIAVAKLYLATKSNIYQRQAVMLVKDDNGQSSGRRSAIGTDALMQLNGVLAGASVKNEVYILHSFQLAQEVAKNLNLDVMYNIRVGLRNVSLYNDRPFTVEFITEFEVPATFMLTIDSKRGGTISDVTYGIPMEESAFKAKVEWGKVTKTPFGDFIATPNEKYLEKAVGMSIQVQRISLENAAIILYNKVQSSEIDKEKRSLIIDTVDPDIQKEIKLIASFDEDEIGSRMTTDCIVIHENLTVKEAMSEARSDYGAHEHIKKEIIKIIVRVAVLFEKTAYSKISQNKPSRKQHAVPSNLVISQERNCECGRICVPV